ncbi:actinorhodin polyketide synthase [Parafrankia soli]|uniref:Actinorhodin polyketide synthase n=1 Tax=Parafrankia soli TaxID=2599596 RepID=A0A1S1R082_9ACTN|nr:acyl carrier protein [Parafrankia soli]OHV39276.1 actinorhodin polyketide synthase [Parafrankia soli]
MSVTTVELSDLRRILTESAGVPQDVDIEGDIEETTFEEMGYDSIAVMELAARITSEFGIPIDDDALAAAKNPRQFLDLVNGR